MLSKRQPVRSALIVDDDPSIREVLNGFFVMFGFNTICATNGEEALQIYQNQRFDVVISDMMMPKMDGMELLKQLKLIDPDVIFFMITGYPTIDSVIEAIKNGAKDYLAKPFNIDEIKIKIDRALLERNLQDKVKCSRGIIWALIISIPLWMFLGILLVRA